MSNTTGDRARAVRFALPTLAVVLTLGIHACRDLSTPTGVSPSGATHSLNPSGTVTVLPDSLRGWAFYNDQSGTVCTDATVCSLVQGPNPTPLGDGSAELATTTASDGKALILADYQGTRLDRITTLSYSTYRQTADAGNNLAIALQLNADFDLTDASVGYQGRLVFEPYQGNGGGVAGNTWQTWNARAGKWWSTKSTVPRGGVNVANPCVQATPCTWNQLLTNFPNVGTHATYGAVVLKAGSGWNSFRGNVDNFTIGIDGANTTFDFELARKLIGLSYDCGRRFRVTNRSSSALTLTWKVPGSTDSAIVAVPGRSSDSASASAEFTTNAVGTTVIYSAGTAVDSAANTGIACAGYRLRVLADDGVVFDSALPRDSVFSPGAIVPFSLSPAAGRGTLVTVVDDTLAAFSGTLVMDRDHVLYAETEAPIVPSADVTDLVGRIRAVHSSSTPEQALQNFMAWYQARVAAVGVTAMSAQLDTADFLIVDTGADSAALRQFDSRLAGTEFLTYTLSNGGTGRFYMTPANWGYLPGTIASRTPDAEQLEATLRLRMREAARQGGIIADKLAPSRSVSALVDDEPDEQTHIIYVNGIYTTEFSRSPGAPSAAATMERLGFLAAGTSRFGLGAKLRSNVMVAYVYNRSMIEQIDAWRTGHHCEAEHAHGARVLRPLHSLKRLAVCKAAPFVLWLVKNDVLEAGRQVLQIYTGIGPIAEDSRKLAYAIRGHHRSAAHTLLVGHSQGNLLISQALSALPSIDRYPINVGDDGCTAALTLASPIARASYPGIGQYYLRGLTVEGDLLKHIGLPNDFDVIHTPAGDSVALLTDPLDQLKQATNAHFVDENYLRYLPSATRVSSELTALSDECSAGSFTISPNPISMTYGQSMRITADIRNRAGRPLINHRFNGGSVALNITTDSIATAFLPTNGLQTGKVTLNTTSKVFATIQSNVPKPVFNPSLTIAKSSWWEITYFSGKIGAKVEESPPNWDGMSPCFLETTFSNDTVVESVTRRCRLAMTADITWENFWNIRTISVTGLSSVAGGSGGVFHDPNATGYSGLILDCSDACINQGYIVRYTNIFNQLVSADTVTGASFSRLPLAGVPKLRQRQPPESSTMLRSDATRQTPIAAYGKSSGGMP